MPTFGENKQQAEWIAECNQLGESQVRLALEVGSWATLTARVAVSREWVRLEEEKRVLAASALRDARELATLARADRANHIPIAASIIATISIITTIFIAVFKK